VSGVSITTTELRPDLIVRGRVVAVGSQEQMYKGHDVLLRALAALRAQGEDLHLQLVGQGRHHQHLRRLAADLGVQAHVTFIPVIGTKGEMTDLLDTAEIFAMPSMTEGLPRVLIEAMARGAVCVGSDVGGIPELLDASVLCPVGDSEALAVLIRRLHNDPDLRVVHSQRNLDRSRDYSEDVLEARRVAWSDAVKMLAGAR
jgi:phosphatidylinositol alpha-1,6-mannosyltransferase